MMAMGLWPAWESSRMVALLITCIAMVCVFCVQQHATIIKVVTDLNFHDKNWTLLALIIVLAEVKHHPDFPGQPCTEIHHIPSLNLTMLHPQPLLRPLQSSLRVIPGHFG